MLNKHNPDSNCVQCCETNSKLESVLDQLDNLLLKVNDPKSVDDMPPMLKMIMKMVIK